MQTIMRLAAGSLVLLMLPVVSGAIEIESAIRVGEAYTSNVNLDAEEENEWVTSVIPSVAVEYQGAGLELNLDYSLEALFYAEESDRNEVFHQLSANSLLDVIGDALQLHARAAIRQVNVSPQLSVTSTNLSVTGNRTDSLTWDLGPEWGVEVFGNAIFGGFARFGRVDYDDSLRTDDSTTAATAQIADADRIEGSASIRSSEDPTRQIGYALVYDFEQLAYDATSYEAEQQSAYLRVDYRLSDGFSVFGLGGLDSDFEDFEDSSLEESRWEAGATAAVGRLRLEAAIGHRFFGATQRFALTHESESVTLRLSYSTVPNTSDRMSLSQIMLGQPGEDSEQEVPPDTGIEEPGLLTRFVQDRADASVTWRGDRSSVGLAVFWDERTNQLQVEFDDETGEPVEFGERDDESSIGASARFSWNPGTRSRLGAAVSWRSRELVTDSDFTGPQLDKDQTLTVSASYGYELGELTSLSFRTGFQKRSGAANRQVGESQFVVADYDEIWVGIDLERRF
ncbi:MAG: TIGR03016 family PEP-CTERM system-associated outer membrane protein [Gammaproteobacteria bacterium]|nr:TIGR03016 family PEP-CTERM system-associated outer membrane protein [Gammaproteobacteria bacterium]